MLTTSGEPFAFIAKINAQFFIVFDELDNFHKHWFTNCVKRGGFGC